MKIAVIMPSLEYGGVQKVITNLYKGFDNYNDIKFSIICCDGSGDMKKNFNKEDIIDLKIKKFTGDYKMLFSLRKVNNILKKKDFDIVIAVPGFSAFILILSKFLISGKFKTVIMIDNKISLLKKGKLKHKLSYFLYKRIYKHSDKIVTAHDVAKNDLIENFKFDEKKILRIYHPMIDYKEIKYAKKPEHLWLDNNYYIIFSAGRLCVEKDFVTLIEAFEIFQKKINNSKLIIAGEGEEYKNLKYEIEKRSLTNHVDLIGFTDNINGFMKYSQMFVLSSKQEAFGIVLVEALANGLDIVSTNTSSGAQKEIIGDNKYGLLSKVGDSGDIAKKMIEIYYSKSFHKKDLQNRSKDFSINKSVLQYYNLFKELNNE